MTFQEQIKTKNEALIRGWGFDVNPNLPLIESDDELAWRTAQQVGTRLFTLGYVVGFYYTDDRERLRRGLTEHRLFDHLSPKEAELFSRRVTKQDRIDCSWLEEGAFALAYCVGLLEMNPLEGVTPALGEAVPLWCDPHPIISNLSLRPQMELLQTADLYYRLHWAARRLGCGHERLELSRIMERRRALDWVLGIAEWDEIPLDT